MGHTAADTATDLGNGETTMGRSKPVIVTMSKVRGHDLGIVLAGRGEYRLEDLVADAIEGQVGRRFTMELCRKDALTMQRMALNDIQEGGKWLNARQHREIEKAFFAAWNARLKG